MRAKHKNPVKIHREEKMSPAMGRPPRGTTVYRASTGGRWGKSKEIKRLNPSGPSEKQVRYALHLLDKAGYSTRFMDARFKNLGATMRQRSGSGVA